MGLIVISNIANLHTWIITAGGVPSPPLTPPDVRSSRISKPVSSRLVRSVLGSRPRAYSISRHLGVLKNAGSILERRDANRIDHSLVEERLAICVGQFLSVVCPEQIVLRQRRKRKRPLRSKLRGFDMLANTVECTIDDVCLLTTGSIPRWLKRTSQRPFVRSLCRDGAVGGVCFIRLARLSTESLPSSTWHYDRERRPPLCR